MQYLHIRYGNETAIMSLPYLAYSDALKNPAALYGSIEVRPLWG